jgi:hypothetical protein
MKASEIASIIKAGGKVKVNKGVVTAFDLPQNFVPVKELSLKETLVKTSTDLKTLEGKVK